MDDLAAVAALTDPVRRELYRYVTSKGRPVGRNEAAEAAGVARPLAAFHLDKLVEAGLLEADFARLTDRKGPGSGRPAKVYRRAPGEHAVSVPPRDYRTLALVLAEVVDLLGGDEVAEKAAHRIGARLGAESAATSLPGLLAERGYEPYDDDGVLRLRNCPFHVLAQEQPLLVCSMNLSLCRGLLEGRGEPGVPRLDPRPGECCVVFPQENSKTNQS